jgi:hypothetical protein
LLIWLNNVTAVVFAAAKEAAAKIQRARADARVARILNGSAGEDRALLEQFVGTVADGL